MQVLVNIDVPDLVPAERFYSTAFGLEVGRRFGDDAIELLGGGAPIYLLHKPAGTVAAAEQARTYARHWTPLHCDLVVDDLDTAVARAVGERLGVRFAVDVDTRIQWGADVGAHKTSMLQDLEAGRPMEIDAVVGAVTEMGRLVGVATPTLDLVLALVRQRAAVAASQGG